jgi:hypothetical protein
MEERLQQLLYAHLVEYHPDVLIGLQGVHSVTGYLLTKTASVCEVWQSLRSKQVPAPFIEEECLRLLIADLWPSRYQYLSTVLDEDFIHASQIWRESGLRTYELINLVAYCAPVFDQHGFNENSEEDRLLRYAIIASIAEYVQGN